MQISTEDTLPQNFGARVSRGAQLDRFGGYDGIAAIHEKAALAGESACADLAAPVALVPENQSVSCHGAVLILNAAQVTLTRLA